MTSGEKSELVRQFAEDGRLTGEIEFMVVGDSRVVADALSAEFDCTLRGQHAGGCLLMLALAAGKQESIAQAVR
jgi:hypothetical protein